MQRLALSVAMGDYDRTRALLDGSVRIDGVDPVFMTMSPEEAFFRAFRGTEFDIGELSLSSYTLKVSQGDCPYVAVPVFLSRAFRHTAIYVRRDRVRTPADLRGKRVGIPEYQLTANVWARSLLKEDHGILPSEVTWVRGGIETPGRAEKLRIQLPPGVRIEEAPEGDTLAAMLDRGDLDAFVGPRAPSCFGRNPQVGWFYADPTAAAEDYYRRTRIFPIMHVVGIRRELVERHRWLPVAVYKAFEAAKAIALERLADPSAPKASLPFLEELLAATQQLMGRDYWPYGVEDNRVTLEAFLAHHHDQGLSARKVQLEELFAPTTYEMAKI
ncbi:ABC transporter substrate-binding protein [Ramlibacter sp. USB13]|uniref:ABC transporter substrate-binding protein n=1 Tax=Ramlibacter cellulosilyticus TaxID=2764187 RepID=A0A923MSL3_9BURK|nr:ABC transporter substrate-binding protein [Ramlibacter cellulosilyticus]MBC5784425.1 ABC transporter substrate-binding protein [Ramlibacter cellulosilyticus]